MPHISISGEAPTVVSQINPSLLLLFFGVLAISSFAYAFYAAVRSRDVLPIATCVGALICSFNEPVYDLLGKIIYATNHPMAFRALDRDVPWFLVLGYVPWVGLLPYLIAKMMAAGASARSLRLLAFGSFLSVVLIEYVGTTWHAWAYYGIPPIRDLGVAPQMAPVPIVAGFLLYTIGSLVSGWRRVLLGFVTALTLPAVYSSASWPMYIASRADVPKFVEWGAAALTLANAALIVIVFTKLAANWYSSRSV